MVTAPVITLSRLRMQTDGPGITTLVCFHGCPLRCKWCINPFSFDPATPCTTMTPQALYEKTRRDELYYLSTGGGVTFGGGEPLLHSEFIKEFRALCGGSWQLCVETSLNVPREQVAIAAECVDRFYVDCKDMNPEIYRSYTGRSNEAVTENLRFLLSRIGPERIVLRLPLIPQFNTAQDRDRSLATLKEMGFTRFDLFSYQIP